MCIVKHLPSGRTLEIISREDDFINFKDIESGIEGSRHVICKDQFELIECSNRCAAPCFLENKTKETT